jgi:hypothetical protein
MTELSAQASSSSSSQPVPISSAGKGLQKADFRDSCTEQPQACLQWDAVVAQLFGGQANTDMLRACQQLRCVSQGDHAQQAMAIRHGLRLLESCGRACGFWASLLEMQLITIINTNGDSCQQTNAIRPQLLSSHLFLLQQAATTRNVQQLFTSFQNMTSAAFMLLKRDGSSSSTFSQHSPQLYQQVEQLLVNDVVTAFNSLLHCLSISKTAETTADNAYSVEQEDQMLHLCSTCMHQALQLGSVLPDDPGTQLQAAVLCSCAQDIHKLVVMVRSINHFVVEDDQP